MTLGKIRSYNHGIQIVLAIAEAAARAIRTAPHYRTPKDEFAVEALMALSQEGRALLLADPGAEPVAEPRAPDRSGQGGGTADAITHAAAE